MPLVGGLAAGSAAATGKERNLLGLRDLRIDLDLVKRAITEHNFDRCHQFSKLDLNFEVSEIRIAFVVEAH